MTGIIIVSENGTEMSTENFFSDYPLAFNENCQNSCGEGYRACLGYGGTKEACKNEYRYCYARCANDRNNNCAVKCERDDLDCYKKVVIMIIVQNLSEIIRNYQELSK